MSIVIPNILWFCTSLMTSDVMVRGGRFVTRFCLFLSSGYKHEFIVLCGCRAM